MSPSNPTEKELWDKVLAYPLRCIEDCIALCDMVAALERLRKASPAADLPPDGAHLTWEEVQEYIKAGVPMRTAGAKYTK